MHCLPKLYRPFSVSILFSFLFSKLFSKVDRTFKFDVTLVSIFEAREGVVVVLYLFLRFRKFSVLEYFEKFSKLLHHQA